MEQTDKKPAAMTIAAAAKLVKRTVPVMEKGQPTGKTRQAAIKASDVLAFAEHADHVVVVTSSGEKLQGDK